MNARPAFLTAYEHQTIAVRADDPLALSQFEAQRLAVLNEQRPGFCTLGHRSVRLAQYAGLVNLGSRILEILPKVGDNDPAEACRGTFLRLLRRAVDLPLSVQGAVGHDLRRQSLLDVFIGAYLKELLGLVRRGLLRRYRSDEEDLGVVRGRLMVSRQVSVHAMRIDRLACRFDELTIDNPWNQVLSAALHLVRPWIRDVDTGRRWLELAAAFDGVARRRDALELQSGLPSDRQVHHYKPALIWAGWIIKLLSPNLRAGSNKAPELLFDMNRLFEAAIASVLKGRVKDTTMRVATQEADRHLAVLDQPPGTPAFRLRPDLVLREHGVVVAVGDTKWKRIEVDAKGWLTPSEADAYQMLAYASAYPCRDFTLLYPWHEGLRYTASNSFRLLGNGDQCSLLHVVCIDVGNDSFAARRGQSGSRFVKMLGG